MDVVQCVVGTVEGTKARNVDVNAGLLSTTAESVNGGGSGLFERLADVVFVFRDCK